MYAETEVYQRVYVGLQRGHGTVPFLLFLPPDVGPENPPGGSEDVARTTKRKIYICSTRKSAGIGQTEV